jgi:hypothetical protein
MVTDRRKETSIERNNFRFLLIKPNSKGEKMKRRLVVLLVVLMMAAVAVIPASAGRGNNDDLGEVYVTSQGLYYDTFVSAESLPPHGHFQKLEDGKTEFGPGDPGYLGGRWWIDNPDEGIVGEMDAADTFLLCPLLGPGRTESNQ